jgi:hypothetical protein
VFLLRIGNAAGFELTGSNSPETFGVDLSPTFATHGFGAAESSQFEGGERHNSAPECAYNPNTDLGTGRGSNAA